MRPNWEEYALKIAEVVALRSEDPYMKVGSCILDQTNRILSVGYNGLASGTDVTEEFWKDRDGRRKYMIHAEINALSMIERNRGVILACTLLPCSNCATAIVSHGIKKVVFKDIYTRDTNSFDIFKFYGIDCIQLGSSQ